MKKYYVRYGEFRNVYAITHAETAKAAAMLESMGFERCTRKEALRLLRTNKKRKVYSTLEVRI